MEDEEILVKAKEILTKAKELENKQKEEKFNLFLKKFHELEVELGLTFSSTPYIGKGGGIFSELIIVEYKKEGE